MIGKRIKVPYTEAYVSSSTDTLSRIAAKFDTTVSELKKINRLMSDAIFPGQIIFVPDENYSTMSRSLTTSSLSSIASSTDGKTSSQLPSATSSYSIPARKKRNSSEEAAFSLSPPSHKVPGRVERDVADRWVAPPRPLTEEEVKRLDEECHERFVKLHATFLSSVRSDEVPGVLLVTPDAVMFDPDEDHPLVRLNGAGDYSMVIPMDCVASASVYHDAEDMRCRRNQTTVQRVTMTHEDGCPQATVQQQQKHQLTEPSKQSIMMSEMQKTSPDVNVSASGDAVSLRSTNDKHANAASSEDTCLAKSIDIESNIPSNTSDTERSESQNIQSVNVCGLDGSVDLLSAGVASLTSLEPIPAETVIAGLKLEPEAKSESEVKSETKQEPENQQNVSAEIGDTQSEIGLVADRSRSILLGEVNAGAVLDDSFMRPDGSQLDSQDVVKQKVIDNKSLGLSKYRKLSVKNDSLEIVKAVDSMRENCNKAADDQPLPVYLCLGVRVKVDATKTSQLETCTRSPIRPEYWYSVPYDKVDHLYAFFVQWTPTALDEEEDATAAEHGFVVVENGNTADEGKSTELSPGGEKLESEKLHRRMSKDWEIVNISELRRRISRAELELLPLPDLSEPSSIISDTHLRQLMQHLPARAEGCAWKLVYSSSKHGFSLKTLYRCMYSIDSPTIIIIKDNHEQIFGALLSCAVKQSDHFYGNGESYLFTFYPEFKKYPWTGINSFFIKGHPESLCVGASEGVNGLWLDGDLNRGRTQTCQTFENELLTVSPDFLVNCLEGWCFL